MKNETNTYFYIKQFTLDAPILFRLKIDPHQLFNNILEMAATLLACGIDPKKSILFQQSCVPQHTELCWQLACLSTMARYYFIKIVLIICIIK